MSTDELANAILPSLQNLMKQIQENFKRTGAEATGRSANSLEIRRTPNALQLWGGDWLPVTETGRRPGKIPYGIHWLQAWGHARGVTDPRALQAIAWNIHWHGTSLYRQHKFRDIYSSLLDKYATSLDKDLGDKVNAIVENFIDKL